MTATLVSTLADHAGIDRDIVLDHADRPHDILASSRTPGAGIAAALLLGRQAGVTDAALLDALARVIRLVECDDSATRHSRRAAYDWADAGSRYTPTRHRLIAVAERSPDREALLDALRAAVSVIESEAR